LRQLIRSSRVGRAFNAHKSSGIALIRDSGFPKTEYGSDKPPQHRKLWATFAFSGRTIKIELMQTLSQKHTNGSMRKPRGNICIRFLLTHSPGLLTEIAEIRSRKLPNGPARFHHGKMNGLRFLSASYGPSCVDWRRF